MAGIRLVFLSIDVSDSIERGDAVQGYRNNAVYFQGEREEIGLIRKIRKTAAKALSAILLLSLVLPAVPEAASTARAAEPVEKKFDFGTGASPVMEGFIGVGPNDLYAAERGYGLDQAINSRLRSGGTDLTNDFVLATSFSFMVDLPNGNYDVTLYSGDLLTGTSTTRLNVTLEGTAAGTIQARQSVGEGTFRTTVADGQLTVGLSGANGGGAYLNGIIVKEAVSAPPEAPASLTVTGVAAAPPSVSLQWGSVTDAVYYNLYRSDDEGAGFAQLAQATGTAYTDTAVVLGGRYAYQVTAVNANGLESAASVSAAAEVPNSGEPPEDADPLPSELPLKLDFGPGEVADGYFGIKSPVAYSPELRYGFANPSLVFSGNSGSADAVKADYLMPVGTNFNVDLPNGDYAVTVTAGDAGGSSETAVSVEGMTAAKIALTSKPAGEYLEQTFEVALVDGQLTFTFSGTAPKINGLVISKLPERSAGETPTVYIAGDSTVQTYDPYWKPQAGWGQMISRYFSSDIAFSNQSIGGRSSKSFLLEGRLDTILRSIKPNDYFLIQFGHNDATISIPERYASPADFKGYLKTYIEGARQRGATPILVTPVGRRDYNADTGLFNVSFPEYVAAMKELAAELNVPLVDLSTLSREYYNTIGPEGTLAVFLHVPAGVYGAFPSGSEDNTHFQEYGAIQIARLLSGGIRQLDLPLASYVTDTEPPAEVPAKPTGLTASSVSNAGAVLNWNAVEGADIYKIYRKPTSASDYTLIGSATVPTITIQGMTEGQSYDVVVTAVNGKGESEHSEPIVIRTKQATLKFDFGLAGSPVMEGYSEVNLSTVYTPERGYGIVDPAGMIGRDRATGTDLLRDWLGYFNVGWKFNVDVPNGLYSVKLYVGDYLGSARTTVAIEDVDYGTVSAGSRTIAEKIIPQTWVSDGQMSFSFGGATAIVNGLEITPILMAPSALKADGIDTDPDHPSVSLSWQGVDDAAKYNVYRGVSGSAAFELIGSPATNAYVDHTVDVGMEYVYQVTTVDVAAAETGPSNTLEVSLVDPNVPIPVPPVNLRTEEVNKNDLTIGWDASEGARAYRVYRSTSENGSYEPIGRSATTGFTDTTVLTTIPYYYKVAAVSAGGVSELSEVLTTPAVTVLYRQAEYLDRALVAVKQEGGVYVGWRMLGTDPSDISFNLYRDGSKVNADPIDGATNLFDASGTDSSIYVLKTVDASGKERTASKETAVWQNDYLAVPIQKPTGGITPAGEAYTYSASDSSVGDLDGDEVYELIVKWDPSNAHDNSQAGYTGNVYIDAYKLDGTRLWRIDLGKNIRAGAHYTQFMVYDLDGDGKAEVAFKTADGTIDGTGAAIGIASADHRNSSGYILQGPEYLTVFDGLTGRALTTTVYDPPRGTVSDWGDAYGNRVDRFLAAVAYLDGEHPSLIVSRGYYTRTVIVAYDYRNGELVKRWKFDSNDKEYGAAYTGQGDHNLSIGDVDRDGKDEITFGAMAIDDNGKPLYNTGLGHGDAQHLGDLDPSRPGLEFFNVHEHADSPYGMDFRDAETGEVLWGVYTGIDTGRGMSADIDPNYLGEEVWAATITNEQHVPITGLYSAKGELISTAIPASTNFGIWWDGDLSRELLDSNHIDKWDYANRTTNRLFTAEGALSNNGTKATPNLQADLFGDWREEAVWRSEDSSELRIYTTTDPTETRLRTLMHDPIYRLGVAWQNVAYNQPPHTSFYLGTGMEEPPAPKIQVVGAPAEDREAPTTTAVPTGDLQNGTYRSAVQVAFEATDEGSGVAATYYRIDNGDIVSGKQATIETEGDHTVQFWSVDREGNEEAPRTLSFTIDLTPPTDQATAAPGKPVLSDDNGHDTGLRDGSYAVTMNLWWGNNGTKFKLYENGTLINTVNLEDGSPSAQTVKTDIGGKKNGTYVYTCELSNAFGRAECAPLTVVVTDASPGQAVLSHDNWDGDGSFKIAMNLWWGTNATEYALYENGVLVDTQALTANTPNAQSAVTAFTGKAKGTYEYQAVLRNEAGETKTAKIKVTVRS
ncbi:fibronectin type III domain-containing protein [Cohnella thailandensis]|uniref:Fibronectin type III domain-containing protein n=1 Tax=Cohnella thailandensis TaxID=557557 RepID=A0A841T089_9BACL|nr:fibronectin type III domain-containing protein [Cohnella thailandensis]